ncbi:hypothetical protein GCM10018966_022230 [Streptomyces yanii]
MARPSAPSAIARGLWAFLPARSPSSPDARVLLTNWVSVSCLAVPPPGRPTAAGLVTGRVAAFRRSGHVYVRPSAGVAGECVAEQGQVRAHRREAVVFVPAGGAGCQVGADLGGFLGGEGIERVSGQQFTDRAAFLGCGEHGGVLSVRGARGRRGHGVQARASSGSCSVTSMVDVVCSAALS